jgi:hypothetical protein
MLIQVLCLRLLYIVMFYLKHNVSGSGFCLQVDIVQKYSNCSLCLAMHFTTKEILFLLFKHIL